MESNSYNNIMFRNKDLAKKFSITFQTSGAIASIRYRLFVEPVKIYRLKAVYDDVSDSYIWGISSNIPEVNDYLKSLSWDDGKIGSDYVSLNFVPVIDAPTTVSANILLGINGEFVSGCVSSGGLLPNWGTISQDGQMVIFDNGINGITQMEFRIMVSV